MNICIIVQNYFPQDIRIQHQAQFLGAIGNSVDIICLRKVNQKRKEVCSFGTIRRGLLDKKRGGVLRYVFEYISFFIWAFFLVAFLSFRKKYDVIQIATLPDFLVFAALIPKILGARVVLDLHEIMPEFYASKYKKDIQGKFFKLLGYIEKISVRFADNVISANHSIGELVGDRVQREIIPIIDTVNEDEKNDELFHLRKKYLNQREDNKYLRAIYTGTLSSLYNVGDIINVINIFQAKKIDISLKIFGEGPQKESLTNLMKHYQLSEKVQFYDWSTYDIILKCLVQSDVVILPVINDIFTQHSLSHKLSEAVYFNIPVIHTRLKSVERYFSDASLFYYDGTIEQLIGCIESVYYDYDRALQKAQCAKSESEKISWKHMKKKYLQVMNGF